MTIRLFRTGPGPLAGFLFACVLCFGLHAQSPDGSPDAAGGPDPATAGETSIVLDAAGEGATARENPGETPAVFLLLRVVLVLALVCACIYGVIWLLKKSTRINAARDPYLRLLAQLPLSQSASARVVSVGAQAFLVGVTEQSVNLIAEITDKELVDAMNLEAERVSNEPVGPFEGVLARFLPTLAGTVAADGRKGVAPGAARNGTGRQPAEPGEAGASASITADFIRRQRERLANAREGGESPGEGAE